MASEKISSEIILAEQFSKSPSPGFVYISQKPRIVGPRERYYLIDETIRLRDISELVWDVVGKDIYKLEDITKTKISFVFI